MRLPYFDVQSWRHLHLGSSKPSAELKAVRGTISKKTTKDRTELKHNSHTSYRYNEPLDAVDEIVFGTKKGIQRLLVLLNVQRRDD